MKTINERQQYEILRSQLELERSSFMSHWKDLGNFLAPRRPRFTVTDVNKGDRRSQNIIDSTGTLALRTLRSGMMSGVTSPARQWFRLTTPDPDLAEFGPVKDWLYVVGQRMSAVYLKSNIYNSLPVVYGDLGGFGTGAVFVEEDFEDVIRTYPMAIGSYYIANNDRLRVDVCLRDFQMTVQQLVEKFGGNNDGTRDIDWSKFSNVVKTLWDNGEYQTWIEVCHVVHPNQDYDPRKKDSRFKKYLSVYFERGSRGQDTNYTSTMALENKFLSMKGYDFFPVLAPRWEVTGEDTYGTNCPGMEALGDVKQLQMGERRGMQAIEKMINPPMTGPTSLRNSKPSILPGDVTFLDVRDQNGGFRPVHEVNFRLEALENKQMQVRQRISRAFYEDLFLMLANSDRRDITAREIEERHEEKLLALGPVLEQLNQDLLDPLIDVSFDIMNRQGLFPPPPSEIQGAALRIEYISLMAQAQKMIGIGSIERFTQFAGSLAATKPEAGDKVNTDQLLDVYGDMLSVPPGIIRTDDEAKKIRAARAEQAQQQANSERIPAMAGAAKDLAGSNLDDNNALTQIVNAAQGNSLQQ